MDALEMLTIIRDRAGLPGENDIPTRTLLRMVWDAELALAIDAPAYYVRTKTQSITTQSIDTPLRYKKLLLAWLAGTSCEEVSPAEEWLLTDNLNMLPSASWPKVIDLGRTLNIYPAPTAAKTLVFNYFCDPVQVEYGAGTVSAGKIIMDEWANPSDDYYNDEWVSLYSLTDGVLTKKGRTKITDYVGSSRTLTVDNVFGLTSLVYAIESFGTKWERVFANVMTNLGKPNVSLNVAEPAEADNGKRS